jgi:hypothetical protein
MTRSGRRELHYVQTAPRQPEPSRKTEKRLLFALFAAPIAWSIHEVASFGIIGRRCAAPGGLLTWQWVLFIGFGVLCFGLAAAGLVTAYRMFGYWPHKRGLFAPEVDNRVTFMAQLGFLLSLILLVNIVLFGIVPAIVHPCGLDSILTDTP